MCPFLSLSFVHLSSASLLVCEQDVLSLWNDSIKLCMMLGHRLRIEEQPVKFGKVNVSARVRIGG